MSPDNALVRLISNIMCQGSKGQSCADNLIYLICGDQWLLRLHNVCYQLTWQYDIKSHYALWFLKNSRIAIKRSVISICQDISGSPTLLWFTDMEESRQRTGTGGWDGDCVIPFLMFKSGPSRAQLISIHFPSCNLSTITMLLQTSLLTLTLQHNNAGRNSQWLNIRTNQFLFNPKIQVIFHADP